MRDLFERLVAAVEQIARDLSGLRADLQPKKRRVHRDEKLPSERRPATQATIQPSELDIRRAANLLRRKR